MNSRCPVADRVCGFPDHAAHESATRRRRLVDPDLFVHPALEIRIARDQRPCRIGIVGNEEQSPGLARLERVGRLIGAPAVPITATFPWLGLASFVPLPVKFRLRFGEPLYFDGDPGDEDAEVQKKVDVVKDALRGLIAEGLAERRGWFS